MKLIKEKEAPSSDQSTLVLEFRNKLELKRWLMLQRQKNFMSVCKLRLASSINQSGNGYTTSKGAPEQIVESMQPKPYVFLTSWSIQRSNNLHIHWLLWLLMHCVRLGFRKQMKYKLGSQRYILELGLSSNVGLSPRKKTEAHTKVCLLLFICSSLSIIIKLCVFRVLF